MGISPAIARISVDLPEPDAPISATISPGATVKLMSLRTGCPPKNDLATPTTAIAAALNVQLPVLLLRTPSDQR